MTYDEAKAMKRFKEYCTCGGFAHSMNGRSVSNPHMDWCPQRDEYVEWYKAMHSKDTKEIQR